MPRHPEVKRAKVRLTPLLFIVIFAVIAAAFVLSLKAAHNASIMEAESATVNGEVQTIVDATASGGQAILFGQNTVPFPSRLRTQGRTLVNEAGRPVPVLKGFNMQIAKDFVWPQEHFTELASKGATINRVVVFWDDLEPTQGSISSSTITNLDTHIARAQAAGMYTQIELHLNVGRYPAWTSAYPTEMEKYARYGQTLTRYIANRFGNPSSPKYTKAVIGFGLNEPPLEDNSLRNGNGSIPYLENIQRMMITWMRAPENAPDWIGFIAYGYAAATPLYDQSFQNPNAVNADPGAYTSVGGNVVIDFHDYFVGITGPTASDPSAKARQWNGMIHPTYQGGPMQVPDSTPAPNYSSSTTSRAQLAKYFEPYVSFSTSANVPLMIGEWGWVPSANGFDAWIQDHMSVWDSAPTVIQMAWDYNVTADTSNDPWRCVPAASGGLKSSPGCSGKAIIYSLVNISSAKKTNPNKIHSCR